MASSSSSNSADKEQQGTFSTLRIIDKSELEDFDDDATKRKRIGGGSFGDVYEAKLNNVKVAVKVLKPKKEIKEWWENARSEIKINAENPHPNILRLIGVSHHFRHLDPPTLSSQPNDVMIVTELLEPFAKTEKLTKKQFLDNINILLPPLIPQHPELPPQSFFNIISHLRSFIDSFLPHGRHLTNQQLFENTINELQHADIEDLQLEDIKNDLNILLRPLLPEHPNQTPEPLKSMMLFCDPCFYFSQISCFEIMRLAEDIARGMEWIHGSKILHRDLKPDNILVDPTNHSVKIIDFGLSAILGD